MQQQDVLPTASPWPRLLCSGGDTFFSTSFFDQPERRRIGRLQLGLPVCYVLTYLGVFGARF